MCTGDTGTGKSVSIKTHQLLSGKVSKYSSIMLNFSAQTCVIMSYLFFVSLSVAPESVGACVSLGRGLATRPQPQARLSGSHAAFLRRSCDASLSPPSLWLSHATGMPTPAMSCATLHGAAYSQTRGRQMGRKTSSTQSLTSAARASWARHSAARALCSSTTSTCPPRRNTARNRRLRFCDNGWTMPVGTSVTRTPSESWWKFNSSERWRHLAAGGLRSHSATCATSIW